MHLEKHYETVSGAVAAVFGREAGWKPHFSSFTFPHGGQFQIEAVGPNSPNTFERLLEVFRKENVPVHRVVGTLGGFTDLSDADLRAIAEISKLSGVEFIGTPISPLEGVEGVREGKHPCEGSFFGLHHRGVSEVCQYLYQMLRGVECGLRTFLIWDIGAFDCAEYMKSQGKLPGGVSFKVSVFAGSAHSRDCENWGWRNNAFGSHRSFSSISSLNPVALPVNDLGALRMILGKFVPLDVHLTTLDSMGGIDRTIDMPDIIQWASPVNVKIERGASVAELMNEQALFDSVIPRVVESARKFLKHLMLLKYREYPIDIRMEPVVK
ncbi:hypothetical protein KGQ34_02790 [Patescibacteria group bacterium]|nr:hypothetical protein [Patescibacteria group bacterium]